MVDLQRELIGSVARGKTKSGKPTVELFSTNKRLEFPALVLFDLSLLETVGIDPNTLGSETVHRRFWAYYTESEKTTSRGNPYRDVQFLEPIENGNGTTAPAPMNDAMLAAILKELQAQTKLLQALAGAVAGPPPEPTPEDQAQTLDQWFSEETPTSPQALLEHLVEAGYEYRSIGDLYGCLKDYLGDAWRGWPPAGDLEGWSHAAKTAMQIVLD